ncbi:hypothetical protein [Rhodovulum visakhapatnamense]|uniref:Tail protein n=1 Tax=Rhodovulum visakhapatnamense TaxID=364297 RepID=A0ABS1RBN0_9RHOB|nr:hypothetical protein [Rhodovulum visakhapatnamense]MBL3577045.1 hypothetical protein [Rhodovulum visakhapatnamense]
MAEKVDAKGPSTGSDFSMQIRNAGGAILLDAAKTNWGVAELPAEVGATLAVDVQAGTVHSIPFSAFGSGVIAATVVTQPTGAASRVHVSVASGQVLVNSVDWADLRRDPTRSRKRDSALDLPTVYYFMNGGDPDYEHSPLTTFSNKTEDTGSLTTRAEELAFTFQVSVAQAGEDPVLVEVTATPVACKTLCGWSCGRGIKLAVDGNDATVLEPGERHASIHVSLSASAYTKAEVVAEIANADITDARVDDYIAAQLTPGGGEVSGVSVSYNPTTYYGSQAKPLTPDDAKGIITSLAGTHGFQTVHICFERGYDYSTYPGIVLLGGQGLLRPHAVLAWGEGAPPIIPGMKFLGDYKSHGLFISGIKFALPGGIESFAGTNIILENSETRGPVLFNKSGLDGLYHPRFTVRNCILPQSINPVDGSSGDIWKGIYRDSCIKPGEECYGVHIQGCFIGWGACSPQYVNTAGADGIPGAKDDTYGYQKIGSDPRWELDGYATPGPNMWTHPFYMDGNTHDINLRDNFVLGSGGSLTQMRGGAVMRNCAWSYGNQAFSFGRGVFADDGKSILSEYSDDGKTLLFDCADGHASLAHDVVVSLAAYMHGPASGNALSEGVAYACPVLSLDRLLVLHDLDPNNPADADRLNSTWISFVADRKDGLIARAGFFGPGEVYENYPPAMKNTVAKWGTQTYNPDGLDLSRVDDATIFRWYDAQRGNAPDTTTDIMDVYWWLREHQGPEIKALTTSFIQFCQNIVGIAPNWRTSAAACSLVPYLVEDGCRWDNPNNWGGDLIPGSFAGDTVALNGHKVFFQDHTLTVAGLDLGTGGHVHAVNGRLNVSAAPTCTGGGVFTIDGCGQIWVAGYTDTDPLTITIIGGRFANTGIFSGPADITLDATLDKFGNHDPHEVADLILAYGEASWTIKSGRTLSIKGHKVLVGFDGTGGTTAALTVESGGKIRLITDGSGQLPTIRECRFGVRGEDPTDVVSSVTLAPGSTLEVDCRSIMVAGTYTLISVDSLTTTGATLTAINVPSGLSASFPAASGGVQTMVLS